MLQGATIGEVPDGVVGRDPELRAIAMLLDEVVDGPAALTLSGEAGIGKSTVWRVGVDQAFDRGFTILSCRPAASEVRLSYAGLGDLLSRVGEDEFHALPAPQRGALHAALLRGPGDGEESPDARAAGAGLLSIIDALAIEAPVLVAIDDVQWLDEPTLRVVQFACRRCPGPVAMLVTERVAERPDRAVGIGPTDPERRSHRPLGPLSLAALHDVVKVRIGRSLPRRTLARIAESSAGNAFYALELARSLDAEKANVAALPPNLRAVLRTRIESLEPATVEALSAVSALASPRVELLQRAFAGADAIARLGPAEDAGVIAIAGGMVRFTHPLLANAVYTQLPPTARRTLHRRLSGVVENVEERARHLALASLTSDAEATAALDEAADHARRRGAPDTAAELLEQAIGLGARDPSRLTQAAEDHYRAGDRQRAGALLEEAMSQLAPGPLRARALARLGVLQFQRDASSRATGLLQQAVVEAAGDHQLRVSAAMELCWALFSTGQIRTCKHFASLAVDAAERFGEPGLIAEALAVRTLVGFLLGEGTDEASLRRALALEDPSRPTPAHSQPTMIAGRIRCQLHQLDEAKAAFAALRQRCIDRGAETDLWLMEFWVLRIACETGDIATAEQVARSYGERSRIVDTPQWVAYTKLAESRVDAWVGRVDEARAAIEQALTLYPDTVAATIRLFVSEALSMAELSVGNFEAAVAVPLPAIHEVIADGFGEPAAFQMVPDVVEALVMLDRHDEAEPLVEWLETSGAAPDRPWAQAVGARCRALLLASGDRADDADAALDQALVAHDRVPLARYDRARTLLVAARAERRRGQRRVAEQYLTEAIELFEAVGTGRWADNARAELTRLGLQPGEGDELTATERQVAELVATGMTNRKVAAAMFISPKTVDAHLGRIYRKLGIRSRAELGWRIAESREA